MLYSYFVLVFHMIPEIDVRDLNFPRFNSIEDLLLYFFFTHFFIIKNAWARGAVNYVSETRRDAPFTHTR